MNIGISSGDLAQILRKRFVSSHSLLKSLNEMVEAIYKIFSDCLNLLGFLKLTAIKSGLPENVLIAFSVKELPNS